MVKIGKEFEWQMSHRLPFHEGPCKNIHGHSYKLLIQLEGETDENMMLIDFYDIEKIINPLIDKLDHSFIVDESDDTMLSLVKEKDFKHYVIKDNTTAEALAIHFLEKTKSAFSKFKNLRKLYIRIYETHDAWAEVSEEL